jgi:hypothetical protein
MAEKRTQLGRAIESAFHELAAALRGETVLEQYEIAPAARLATERPARPSVPPLDPPKADRA